MPGGDGLLDLEKELSCSICTDILHHPLTLLDCLHSFCGPCLKEWFSFQAASAQRRPGNPYTCPSCRDSVRGTKADWRLTTLLEGYLKANPDRAKSDEEKAEMDKIYRAGDNVIPKAAASRRHDRDRDRDREDEQLLSQVRELSMTDFNGTQSNSTPGRRQAHSHRPVLQLSPTQESEPRQVEHQSSLRSLLSASPVSAVDAGSVQQEILQSIYAEGLLDGIDIDNLSTQQEEELTERIAEAYRRRQRRRDRSGNRERRQEPSRSPQPEPDAVDGAERSPVQRPRVVSASEQDPRPRPRVPIARPHIFEQTPRVSTRDQLAVPPASRSVTDLSGPPSSSARRRRRMSTNARSSTDPESESLRAGIRHVRASSHNPPTSRTPPGGLSIEVAELPGDDLQSYVPSPPVPAMQTIRPAASIAAFAPEPISNLSTIPAVPSVNCNRCQRPNIQFDLHYHCSICWDGDYDVCLSCYRQGQGCMHWFGYGYLAYERWQQLTPSERNMTNSEEPHVLTPRKYTTQTGDTSRPDARLGKGGFCELCYSPCNDCYWHCSYCLEGAWGFCTVCVQQGKHCSHPLLPVAATSLLHQSGRDSAKPPTIPLPHLRDQSYSFIPVLTDCDICQRSIHPNNSRYHCYTCSDGDYDVCTDCYDTLISTGKVTSFNGPNGWRRCPSGHRMAVVGYQDLADRGQQRITLRDLVGGWRHRELPAGEDDGSFPPPSDSSLGLRCLAGWSRFPGKNVTDELSFPKNAEIREVEDINSDWCLGTYAGKVGLFPSNHVRRL